MRCDPAATLSQISIGTRMACGARNFVGDAENGKLWFNVLRGKLTKIVITLNCRDYYDVELIKINPKDWTHKVLERHEDIDCEQLSETVYHMTNK